MNLQWVDYANWAEGLGSGDFSQRASALAQAIHVESRKRPYTNLVHFDSQFAARQMSNGLWRFSNMVRSAPLAAAAGQSEFVLPNCYERESLPVHPLATVRLVVTAIRQVGAGQRPITASIRGLTRQRGKPDAPAKKA